MRLSRILAILGTLSVISTLALALMMAGKVGAAPTRVSPVHFSFAHSCAQAVAGEASCNAILRSGKVTPNASSPGGYNPADLQGAYKLPSATAGKGQTVAIVDAYNDPNAEADLQVYRKQFGLPTCTTANGCFRKVSQTGTTSYPSSNGGWAQEISLDLDMVSAICPN